MKANNATARFRETPKGVLTNLYSKQKYRCRVKNRPMPSYSLSELHSVFLDDPRFIAIFHYWINSGKKKNLKPSIDRIDPEKPYSLDNIQMMTWGENRSKGDSESIKTRRTSVLMFSLSGEKLFDFPSIKEAAQKVGISQGLIVMCCQGKRNQAAGRVWRYGDRYRCRNSSIYKVVGNIYENSEAAQ
jgi:hypothetical protein